MKFFIVASLLALAVAESVEDTPSVKAARVAHHLAQAYDTAVHMQAKANAEMYKAHLPFVYTHQTPYVYNPAHFFNAPVTFMVYNHNLHKREAKAEAEVFCNNFGCWCPIGGSSRSCPPFG